MSRINRQRRGFGFVVVGSVLAACSVDTSDVHFVPDEVLSGGGTLTGVGNTGTGNSGAGEGGAPESGGSSSTGGSGNKAGSTGKAGQATGGATATAGSPATGGVTSVGGSPPGGAGGMGGMPIGCPNAVANRNEPLIDNFDDGDPGLPMPPLGGRVGGWFAINDGTPGAIQQPPANDPMRPPKPAPPGFDARGYALYTQGKGFLDWGAGLGITFSNSAMKACVYDASIHAGIRFRVTGKITGPDAFLHVHLVTTEVADREHSGTCDAMKEKCYDNFNFDVPVPGVGMWQEHTVPFTDFKQGGWGAPKKFYASHLLNLEFVTGPGADFEFGIDQIEFY